MQFVLAKVARRFPIFRIGMRRIRRGFLGAQFWLQSVTARTNANLVVFSAYGGHSFACSPKAIYQYMLHNPEYAAYSFVWLFTEPERYAFLQQNERTKVLRFHSKEADRAVACAKYWIINFTAPDYWVPRRDQIYLQCWHGTPLKKLGFDLASSQNAMNSVYEIHRRYAMDAKKFHYLLSPSPFASEAFSSAWNLKAVGKEGAVLEIGYPRNDFLFSYTEDDVKSIRERLDIPDDDRKILLYAPTWRDNQYDTGRGYVYESPVDFDYLQSCLENDYIILFRAHYLVANSLHFEKYGGFLVDVSNVDDINDLYVISDMLITDYSSVFFDYANLKRPILFYMYDMEFYRSALHDFYLEPEALPGEIVKTAEALVRAVRNAARPNNSDKRYQAFSARFNPLDDGNASKRVVEVLFHD